ncbi:MAG: hypothetical protein ACE5I7_15615, partial [Candidatus Binatia bacterium]
RPELRLHAENRLLLWNLHHYSLVSTVLPIRGVRNLQYKYPSAYNAVMATVLRSERTRVRDYVRLLMDRDSLVFQDRFSAETTSRFLRIPLANVEYVPVALDMPELRPRRARRPGPVHACWVGRLYDFKIHILLHTLRRFSELAARRRECIVFHVVGNGPYGRTLDRQLLEHEHFKVVHVGELGLEALEDYLRREVDIVLAMGMSALEAARLTIPTVLLDMSRVSVRGRYRYRWLFERSDHDVGHAIGDSDLEGPDDSLERIVTELGRSFQELGDRCFRYCAKHHDLAVAAEKFLEAAACARLRFRDIPPGMLRKSAVRTVYERLKYRR